MTEDENRLRQRLTNVTTNRPALERAVMDATEGLLGMVPTAAEAVRRAETSQDASELPGIQRRIEAVSGMTTALGASIQQLDVLESQLRQGIAQLTAERQVAASTEAARSAAWAAWAVVIATAATVLVALGVAIWDHIDPSAGEPAPAATVTVTAH